MKQFISILSFLIIVSCSSKQESFNSLSNKQAFNNSDIESIKSIIEYFESKVGINKDELSKSYLLLFEQTVLNSDSIFNNVFVKGNLRSFISGLPKSVKSEIWTTNKATAYRSYDNMKFAEPIYYDSFDINPRGKYIELLKEISKEDRSIKFYVDEIILSGCLPSYFIISDLVFGNKDNKGIDLESDYWRMIIAIHYFTMLEEEYRYMELSNKRSNN